jgi:hypothetical protein
MKTKLTEKEILEVLSFARIDLTSRQIASLDYLYNNYDSFVINNLEGEVQKKVDKINKIGVTNFTDEQLSDFRYGLNHYYGLSIEVKETLSNYMIVATFSFYEKTVKKLLSLTNKVTSTQLNSCYRNSELRKLLKSKFHIEYNILNNFKEIEELRYLNNAIKHNGKVGNELNKANGKWILNSYIGNTYDDFTRLKDAPVKMLTDLMNKILNKF